MASPDETADVAIVGCGPVGQLLAILLGQRGWRVRVLERWPAPYPLPRAVHYDHEVARILQAAGVSDALSAITEPASVYEWRNAAGDVLLRIGRDAATSPSGWPESTMFCQPDLERVLDARLRELPSVSVERGCEVTDLAADGGGVRLAATREGGAALEVRARFAVGCDGAGSTVRGRIGAGWQDLGFQFDWLVVDVRPGELRWEGPMNWQLCDPARPTTLVSGGPGRRRFEFMRLPHETQDELSRAETAWKLLAPWNLHPGNAALERHAVYTFGARWADCWRRGRVLLAGDAAHLMPPFAGQGLCSGLRDAANLAWKLDLVLSGRAGQALLDTYESERASHVRAMIDLSVALGRVICVADPEEAAARDRRMIADARERGGLVEARLPPLGPGCFAPGDPRARQPFPQARVRAAGRTGRFDDVAGRGFRLVSPRGDPGARLAPDLAVWFASVGGATAHVAPGGPIEDLTGGYARWFEQRGVAVALQRPDFAVFGAAETEGGANALVAGLRRALGG
jgi:2-polyprenyl-6-methoxyphenol hydroxylase-like FAD-dependent oxidoreductase